MPLWSWALFLPLLTATIVVWHLIRLISVEAAQTRVTDQLVLGRRLLPSELHEQFENYIDLTAEFTEPRAIRESAMYRNFPVLDGGVPTLEGLASVISDLRPGRTFVHCAQGHGRTALFAAALLLESDGASTVEDALEKLTASRPGMRLNPDQRRCLEAYAKSGSQKRSDLPNST